MPGRGVRNGVALGGLAALLLALGAALGEGPLPRWLPGVFAAWCVATPYWWWLEHRLYAAASDPQAFRDGQRHSQLVWLGGVAALGVLLLRRAG